MAKNVFKFTFEIKEDYKRVDSEIFAIFPVEVTKTIQRITYNWYEFCKIDSSKIHSDGGLFILAFFMCSMLTEYLC